MSQTKIAAMIEPGSKRADLVRLDRPILVTGTPRSGKSVVAEIIGLAPEFEYVGEQLLIWDFGLGRRSDDRRGAAEASEEVRREIVESCATLVARAGKSRYVDAFSYHALRIPFVHRVMPEARIIHIIRDPVEAIPEILFGWTYKDPVRKAIMRRRKGLKLSTLPAHALRFTKNYVLSRVRGKRATWGPRVPGLSEFVAAHSAAEVAAFQWRRMTEIALDDLETLPADRYLNVRFDQLLTDPRPESRRIADFCDVADPAGLAEAAVAMIDPAIEFEKKVFPSEAEWAAIAPLIAPLQDRLGFPRGVPGSESA